MRLLFLCKRQYTGRDLLDDRYGRLHALPVALAARGHEVSVVAASYRRRGRIDRIEQGVRWLGVDALPWLGAVPVAWRSAAATLSPDLVIASADALQLAGGAHFAHRLGVPSVLDLYDDYEAFALTRIPGLRRALRSSCAQADAVLAVSGVLAGMLPERGVNPDRIHVLGNGVPEGFVPSEDRRAARARLGLPLDGELVGTAGALSAERGTDVLLAAVRRLQVARPGVRLVLAGPRDARFSGALPPGTIDLGTRPHVDIALLFRALNVGVICNRDSAFARACHPMKLVEMAACGTPLVAADLGEVSRLLASRPDARYRSDDPEALAARIAGQLDAPRALDPMLAEGWPALAGRLERVLEGVLSAPR